MRRHPLKQRVAAWLAFVAMILHASWPLIADGKPKAFDPSLELCSAHGVGAALDKTERSAPVAPPAETGLLEHCPFCGSLIEVKAEFEAILLTPSRTYDFPA